MATVKELLLQRKNDLLVTSEQLLDQEAWARDRGYPLLAEALGVGQHY